MSDHDSMLQRASARLLELAIEFRKEDERQAQKDGAREGPCPKCGAMDATIEWHRGAGDRPPRMWNGCLRWLHEHLHVTCVQCRYEWELPVLDSDPDPIV